MIFLEVMNPGLFIAVVGTVMIALGILVLFMGAAVYSAWGAATTVLVAIAASWGTLMVYRKWAPPGDKPVTLSKDSLPGMTGKVEETIPAGGTGEVRVAGQKWHATSPTELTVGTPITVDSVDGLILNVRSN